MRLELIPDRRNWWKFWSVRLSGLGAVVLMVAEFAPQTLHSTWALLPVAVRDTLPDGFLKYTGIALIILSMIARGIKQKRLEDAAKVD